MRHPLTILDRYMLRQVMGTQFTVLAVVMSLMVLENLPRVLKLTQFSGHRALVIFRTVAGTLPEYLGIGLVTGLYLALALGIRRLALRGELRAIEASGVSPLRWMRMPVVFSAAIATLIFAIQGWLLPAGEAMLSDTGERMEAGEYGIYLEPNRFIDVGNGSLLSFTHVDRDRGEIEGIFLVDSGRSYAASSGRISMAPSGKVQVELKDGQAIEAENSRVAQFRRLDFTEGETGPPPDPPTLAERLKRSPAQALVAMGGIEARATLYARMFWPLLALITPLLAYALARPSIRSTSAMGLLTGLVVQVAMIKSISLVSDLVIPSPELAALCVLAAWIALVPLLLAPPGRRVIEGLGHRLAKIAARLSRFRLSPRGQWRRPHPA